MDSNESNQLTGELDLTGGTLLPTGTPWSHDPETSKWFLQERSSRLRRDTYQVHSILYITYNHLETDREIESKTC